MTETSPRLFTKKMAHAHGRCCNLGCCAALHPSPCCPEGKCVSFVHPLFASPSRLAPVRGPGATVRAPPSCSTLLVCNWDREHTMDSHRALPAHADDACGILATRLTCAHTSHLAATSGTQHTADRLIRHAVISRDVTERFSLLDTPKHGFPCRGRDLPTRIRCGLRVTKLR
jgi:hypothetical protein